MAAPGLKKYKDGSYINAIVHLLYNCVEFRNIVLELEIDDHHQPIYILQILFRDMQCATENTIIDAAPIGASIDFDSGTKPYANEFVETLIDNCIHYAFNANSNTTPLYHLFYFVGVGAIYCTQHAINESKNVFVSQRKILVISPKDTNVMPAVVVTKESLPNTHAWK